MNLLLRTKPKVKQQEYKCYRCGHTSQKKEDSCPKCSQENIQINMIHKVE